MKWSHSVKCNLGKADHLHTAGWQCKWGDEIGCLVCFFNFLSLLLKWIDDQGVETAFNSLNWFNLIWYQAYKIYLYDEFIGYYQIEWKNGKVKR